MADKLIHTLLYPITVETFGDTPKTTTITELHLDPRVKGKHLRASDPYEGRMAIRQAIIAALAGITFDEADEIDEDDFEAIERMLNGDTAPLAGAPSGAGQETGGTLSLE